MRGFVGFVLWACSPEPDPPAVVESDPPLPSYPSITQPDTGETAPTTDTGTAPGPSPTEFTGPATTARLANMSPDVATADVCLSYDNGASWTGPWFSPVVGSGLAQRLVSAKREIPAGSATTRVVTGDAGCDTSVPGGNHELPAVFQEGADVQITVMGAILPPNGYEFAFIEALAFADLTSGPPTGAWLRFQHAAIGTTTAWPAISEGGILTDIGITETAYPGMKGYVDVAPFDVGNLVIRHDDDVLLDLGPRAIAAGSRVTMHLVGGLGLPLAVVWCDDEAASSGGLTACELVP